MRPTTILSLCAAVALGFIGLGVALWAFIDRTGGKLWFYWVAPLLVLGFGAMFLFLTIQYLWKVGRLEVKGKPRQ